MKMSTRIVGLMALSTILAGCATEPKPERVKPVTVRVTSSDFCPILKGIFPPTGKFQWGIRDTPESIQSARRLNAAVDKRCSPRSATPTS